MKRIVAFLSTTLVIAFALTLLLAPATISAAGFGNGPGGGRHGSSNWHLYGYLTQMPEDGVIGEWMIDDQAFLVNENTILSEDNSELALGAYAHAVGTVNDEGQRVAYRVETLACTQDCVCANAEETWRLFGEVEMMPEDGLAGQWRIAGEIVTATEQTNFRERWAPLEVGATVVSAGCYDEDGHRIASMIGTVAQHAGSGQAGGGQRGHGHAGGGPRGR